MREIIIQEEMLYNNNNAVWCAINNNTICHTYCAWFNKSIDKTCPVINVYCKEHLIGILKENDA